MCRFVGVKIFRHKSFRTENMLEREEIRRHIHNQWIIDNGFRRFGAIVEKVCETTTWGIGCLLRICDKIIFT